jgi:hypothetical protein
MMRILLPFSAGLAACTSSPQESAMPSQSPESGTAAQGSNERASEAPDPGAPNPAVAGAGNRAAEAPVPAPVSAENPGLTPPPDSPAEAEGRRILSAAFVRVGPDGHLTVELRNGRVLVLRDVAMRAKDYCGVQLLAAPAGARHCGGYAEVAAARPGGAPASDAPAPGSDGVARSIPGKQG